MSRYRIVINRELCVGDGLCQEGANGTFHIDEELCCVVRDAEGNSPEDILFAAWNCPNGCISLYNEATGQKVWPGVLGREELDDFARRKHQEMDPQEWRFWRDLGGGD